MIRNNIDKKKPSRFFVQYNGKTFSYKSLACALNLIRRKGWQPDYENDLWLCDSNGDSYHFRTGERVLTNK